MGWQHVLNRFVLLALNEIIISVYQTMNYNNVKLRRNYTSNQNWTCLYAISKLGPIRTFWKIIPASEAKRPALKLKTALTWKFQQTEWFSRYWPKRAQYCFDQTAWPTKMLMPYLSFSDNLLRDEYIIFQNSVDIILSARNMLTFGLRYRYP